MTSQSPNSLDRAVPPPAVLSVHLEDGVLPRVIDLGDLLSAAAPSVVSLPLADNRPATISIAITNPPIKVRSFVFSTPHAPREGDIEKDALGQQRRTPNAPRAEFMLGRRLNCRLNMIRPCAATSGPLPQTRPLPPAPAIRQTRIKPPGDVIKLEDRLHYLLQPSLESLLSEGALAFPCRPYPYQFEGMAFLYPRHAALLADEMGLGKTMQAITAIRLLLHRLEIRSVLLVCPKPLVTNWQREFQQWAPEVPVMIIEGDQAKRAWQWRLPDVPLRIANYEILLRDRELFDNPLPSQAQATGHPERSEGSAHYPRTQGASDTDHLPIFFDLVLLDESQRIKNRASATSEVVRSIPRKRSWALTGTPVENSTDDLVGIFEFLAPGFLLPDMKPRKMGRAVSDYILRRTKDQVLADLPPKLVHDEHLDLTPEQRETYRLAEDEGVLRLTDLGASATIRHVFELILRLKQICNFDPATGSSAKLERLEADLEEIAQSGRKAIVFSQWVTAIRQLSAHLARFGPLEYHGEIPTARREAIIEGFRCDDSLHVLLMSYGAGGVGLNLQFANYVFLFDRWWNPAVEDQAINRAHRIGIDAPVYVTRFLMLDTIEERIDRILQEKRELFETIFSDAAAHKKLGLTQEELFGLFQIKCPGGPIDKAA
jgi:SNF2 family DNA or RNA helicase